MNKTKEIELQRLNDLIDSWKTINNVPWKDWAYGYLLCLHSQSILDSLEVTEISDSWEV